MEKTRVRACAHARRCINAHSRNRGKQSGINGKAVRLSGATPQVSG